MDHPTKGSPKPAPCFSLAPPHLAVKMPPLHVLPAARAVVFGEGFWQAVGAGRSLRQGLCAVTGRHDHEKVWEIMANTAFLQRATF